MGAHVRAVRVQRDEPATGRLVVGSGAVDDEVLSEESLGHDLPRAVPGGPARLEPARGVVGMWETALLKRLGRALETVHRHLLVEWLASTIAVHRPSNRASDLCREWLSR